MATAGSSPTKPGSKNATEQELDSPPPKTVPKDLLAVTRNKDEIRSLRESIDELQRNFQRQLVIQEQQLDILTRIAEKGIESDQKRITFTDDLASLPKCKIVGDELENDLLMVVQESRLPNQENLSRNLDRLGDFKLSDRSFRHWVTAAEIEALAPTPTIGPGEDITWNSSFKDLSLRLKELYAEILAGKSPENIWGHNLDSGEWSIEVWRRREPTEPNSVCTNLDCMPPKIYLRTYCTSLMSKLVKTFGTQLHDTIYQIVQKTTWK